MNAFFNLHFGSSDLLENSCPTVVLRNNKENITSLALLKHKSQLRPISVNVEVTSNKHSHNGVERKTCPFFPNSTVMRTLPSPKQDGQNHWEGRENWDP